MKTQIRNFLAILLLTQIQIWIVPYQMRKLQNFVQNISRNRTKESVLSIYTIDIRHRISNILSLLLFHNDNIVA